MNVSDAIRNRRSIRSYLEKEVEDEKLREVLEAGRLAPSASNRQEWRYIIVKDKNMRKKLREAASNQVNPIVRIFLTRPVVSPKVVGRTSRAAIPV